MDNSLVKLYKISKTILTTCDLAIIWQMDNMDNLKSKAAYYVDRGDLIRLRRGIFAKDENYNTRELATSIYAPSYISFETVLREEGVIFQYYNTIFVASKWPKNIKINNYNFTFRKIKKSVLYNTKGIIVEENYSIASRERAFLDTIYLFKEYYFDNLRKINWEKCFDLVKIYNNRSLEGRLEKYYNNFH